MTMHQVQQIKQGDIQSFRAAYQEYHARLYRYVYKYSRSHYLAEETVQLTFIRLWEKRESLSDEYALSTQLYRMVKSTLIDLLRKEAVRATTAVPDILPETVPDSSHVTEQKQEVQQVMDAIETLPRIRKKVFKLSRLEGLSHKEIAAALSVSPKTVEAHITKAIRHLRESISFLLL